MIRSLSIKWALRVSWRTGGRIERLHGDLITYIVTFPSPVKSQESMDPILLVLLLGSSAPCYALPRPNRAVVADAVTIDVPRPTRPR